MRAHKYVQELRPCNQNVEPKRTDGDFLAESFSYFACCNTDLAPELFPEERQSVPLLIFRLVLLTQSPHSLCAYRSSLEDLLPERAAAAAHFLPDLSLFFLFCFFHVPSVTVDFLWLSLARFPSSFFS